MTQDATIDEVRAVRDELAKEHEYDIDAIFADLRRLEAASGREHVSLPARRVLEPDALNVPSAPARGERQKG